MKLVFKNGLEAGSSLLEELGLLGLALDDRLHRLHHALLLVGHLVATDEVCCSHRLQGERPQNANFAAKVLQLEAAQVSRHCQGSGPGNLVVQVVPREDLGQHGICREGPPREVEEVVVARPAALREHLLHFWLKLCSGVEKPLSAEVPEVPPAPEGLEARLVANVSMGKAVPAQLAAGAEGADLVGIEALLEQAGCQHGVEVHVEDTGGRS